MGRHSSNAPLYSELHNICDDALPGRPDAGTCRMRGIPFERKSDDRWQRRFPRAIAGRKHRRTGLDVARERDAERHDQRRHGDQPRWSDDPFEQGGKQHMEYTSGGSPEGGGAGTLASRRGNGGRPHRAVRAPAHAGGRIVPRHGQSPDPQEEARGDPLRLHGQHRARGHLAKIAFVPGNAPGAGRHHRFLFRGIMDLRRKGQRPPDQSRVRATEQHQGRPGGRKKHGGPRQGRDLR